ncbi:glycosyltransferase family 4 protein [Chitinophaga barathri]|uniref:Glycosyltransferase family 1 protein n=1 Tax=Chitinophaga barathri TaxID=1647451 RepID=A0A3N4MES8_9BACT|nr:glycosyltransferase family 1 protein [Chitinophaga barathri]RPD40486.1 glycosyltransferase family 1 protein [Chitinophaga barathri]
MKVLFDHQTFTLQEFGGISRYYYEVIRRGIDDPDMDVDVSLFFSNNAYLNKNTYQATRPFVPGKNFRGKTRLMYSINKTYSLTKLKISNYDVFHPTYYDPYFLKHIGKRPFVVTFLDMIHEKFSNRYASLAQDKTIFNNKKILLQESSAVIAISESTKKDIMDIFGTDGSKIKVIHLGNSLVLSDKKEERLHSHPYLLFVGNRNSYKNFQELLTLAPELVRQYDLHIICAGGGRFSESENAAIRQQGLHTHIHHFPINDDTLRNLYENAEIFVFPSLYEGFGIPVLEAFACGCPCILSTGGSLPEVGGDAAMYFNPEDGNSLYNCIRSLMDDSDSRKQLAAKGYERLKLFSWDKTYEQSVNLYNSIKR